MQQIKKILAACPFKSGANDNFYREDVTQCFIAIIVIGFNNYVQEYITFLCFEKVDKFP